MNSTIIQNGKRFLGIDVGGVILDFVPHRGGELDFNGSRYLETPEVENAIDAIRELNRSYFKNNIYLVSRVSAEYGPARVLEWLSHREFFKRTEIPESHFNYCFERHEKAPICKTLGITHFVDDRAEVLKNMVGFVPNLYQFQSLDENRHQFAPEIPNLHFAHTWSELVPMLMHS